MADSNPYQQPQSDLAVAQPQQRVAVAVGAPNKASLADAIRWFGQAMSMLSGNWGLVIGLLVVVIVLNMAVQFVPLIGGLAAMFVMTLLYAGLVKVFHRLDTEGRAEFADLFAGFSEKTAPLLLLALIQLLSYAGVMAVAVAVMFAMMGVDASLLAAMETGQLPDPAVGVSALAVAGVFMFMVLAVTAMLFYFAIPLIFLGDLSLRGALAASFRACLKNLLPMIVYGIAALLLVMVAMIPAFLGLLVVMPVLAGAYYVSFKQLFVNTPQEGGRQP